MFRWKQVGFGDLVSSPYLASCVLGWKLQVGGTLATFLCGGVVEFPSDFRQFLEGMEIVAVYSQFGNMEVLIGVECQLKVEQDRFAVCEKAIVFPMMFLQVTFSFHFSNFVLGSFLSFINACQEGRRWVL